VHATFTVAAPEIVVLAGINIVVGLAVISCENQTFAIGAPIAKTNPAVQPEIVQLHVLPLTQGTQVTVVVPGVVP